MIKDEVLFYRDFLLIVLGLDCYLVFILIVFKVLLDLEKVNIDENLLKNLKIKIFFSWIRL